MNGLAVQLQFFTEGGENAHNQISPKADRFGPFGSASTAQERTQRVPGPIQTHGWDYIDPWVGPPDP